MSARATHRARPSGRTITRSPLARHPLSIAAQCMLLALAGPALAQDAAAPQPASGAVLPTLTVKGAAPVAAPSEGTGEYKTRASNTATKMDLSNRETPQAISVVTRTQIEDFSLRSANDVLSSTTGVRVERVETDRNYFSARGFDILNFQIDGIGLPFATGDQMGDIDTAPYDRVEVLKGANGLLSATGTPSATVNFVRKRPTPKFQASAGLTLGSWNDKRVDGDIAGPLNEAGTVRGRLVLAAQDRDSYLDRRSQQKTIVSGLLEADLGSNTVLTAGVTQQSNRPEGVMWGAIPLDMLDAGLPRKSSSAPRWAYWDTDDTIAFAELSHALSGGWQVKGTLTHRKISSDAEMLYIYGSGGALYTYPSKYRHSERQWLADVYASGPFSLGGRQHEAVIGMNWSQSSNRLRSIYSEADIGLPITDGDVLNGSFPKPDFDDNVDDGADFKDRRRSVYGVVRFNASDALKVFTGANVTHAKSAGTQYGDPHRYSKTKAAPYLGAVYDIDAQHSLYASYAEIFHPQYKAGTETAILPPIEGSNAEIGVKGEWLDGKLNGSFSVFRVEQDNIAGDESEWINGRWAYPAVDARSVGFELDVVGRLTPRWDISAGYAQFRVKDNVSDSEARGHVPRRSLHLMTTYKLPMVEGLKIGAKANWQSRTFKDIGVGGEEQRVAQSSYVLLDLMASYEFTRNLSATFKVNNVTNEKYISSLQWAQSFYGDPRHYSVTLNWKY